MTQVSNVFLAVGLLFGLGYTFLTPPLRVPDEASHFYRAYSTSHGACVGPPAIPGPFGWREMTTHHIWLELPPNTTPQEMVAFMRPPQNRPYGQVGAFAVGNVYNCLPYLPGAAGIAVAGWFHASPVQLMSAGRVSNLLAYLLLIWLALRLLPAYQLLMAAIALMPMALHQAGSLSADNFAIALSCLFVAYVLKLAYGDPPAPLTARQLLALSILLVCLALCKTLLYLAALLLLIPLARFRSNPRRLLWFGGWVALMAGALAAWQWIDRVNIDRLTAIRGEHGILMSANLHYVLTNPVHFLSSVAHTLAVLRFEYFEEFIGKLGWLSIPLPDWLVWTYLALLLLIAVASPSLALGKPARILLAAVAIVNALSAFVVVWTFEIPTAAITPGGTFISGVQGRYLIPFAFPLLVAISFHWIPIRRHWLSVATLCVVILANSLALHEIGKRYSTNADAAMLAYDGPFLNVLLAAVDASPPAAAARYDRKLVRRPGSTPEDGKVYFVSNGQKRWIVYGEWISKHGFTWPQDVLMIPAEELDKIPLGEPIQTK